jgi:hypothetical protein
MAAVAVAFDLFKGKLWVRHSSAVELIFPLVLEIFSSWE